MTFPERTTKSRASTSLDAQELGAFPNPSPAKRMSLNQFNFSGLNPLRNSRVLRKQPNSSVGSTSLSATAPCKNQIIPTRSYSDCSDVDSRAPPPKASARNFLPVNGFESSSFDEFHFSSPRLRSLRRSGCRASCPSVPAQAPEDHGKLTVVLDVDETLIHSKISPKSSIHRAKQDCNPSREGESSVGSSGCEEFEIVLSDGEVVRVAKRPGLDEFLQQCAGKYEIMAYTAGLRQYAEPLLNWLDPHGKIFTHRLYRDSCLFSGGYYVKDLEKVQRDLSRTVLVDNNLCCFLPQLSNGIPISSFYDDSNDDALKVLKGFLEALDVEKDVRHMLTKSFNLVKSLGQTRDLVLG